VDFGTLEVRVPDICTTVDEAVSLVALIQALMAKLVKLLRNNQSWVIYDTPFIQENKWRAARFGLDGKLIDWGKQQEVPMRDLARELLLFVDDVVDDLGSRAELETINTIIENGTSADRQLAVYNDALQAGANEQEAMQAVVDHLIEETYQGWG
jgi:carboxylate-amine ligase